MTAAEVINALAKLYGPPENAFLTDVRNTTGFSSKVRSADAVAMSLWPSRGVYLTGFEVKVSRADWIKELKNPAKAEEIARYCRLWFVAAPIGLIKAEEVPPNWGLIEIREAGGTKITKSAQPNEEQPPTWEFFASLLRNVAERYVPTAILDAKLGERYETMKKNYESSRKFDESRAQNELTKLRTNIAAFEQASGVAIDRYSDHYNREIGEAVKLVRSMLRDGNSSVLSRLASAKHDVEVLLSQIVSIEAILADNVPVLKREPQAAAGDEDAD